VRSAEFSVHRKLESGKYKFSNGAGRYVALIANVGASRDETKKQARKEFTRTYVNQNP